jgi:hypothetical protein
VTDLQYGAALSSVVQIRDGDYADLTGAALVMITVGMNEKAGGATNRNDPAGRLKLLESNVGIYKQILPEIFSTVPGPVILVVTDPPDPLADFVRTFGFTRVLSTGTDRRAPPRRLSGQVYPKTAQEQGSQLLSKLMVSEAVAELKKQSERCRVKADGVITRLVRLGFANMTTCGWGHPHAAPSCRT